MLSNSPRLFDDKQDNKEIKKQDSDEEKYDNWIYDLRNILDKQIIDIIKNITTIKEKRTEQKKELNDSEGLEIKKKENNKKVTFGENKIFLI